MRFNVVDRCQFLSPYVQAAIGLVCIAVAAPMMLGIVGRSRYFGIRTTEALVSDDDWRKINAFGGRRLARCSSPVALLAVLIDWKLTAERV